MTFQDFAKYLQKLEETASRLEMTAQLADLFQKLDKSEIQTACYLMQGKLVPQYESLEFQLSVKMVIRALARTQDVSKNSDPDTAQTTLFGDADYSFQEKKITTDYKKLGDLGLVAEELFAKKSSVKKLTLTQVFDQLKTIAMEGGTGSQDRKLLGLVKLLNSADALSAKFICRIIIGKLRLGFSTMTMIDALSWAQTGTKDESKDLENAYQKKADIGKLAQVYLSHQDKQSRAKALDNYDIEIGVPIVPALCQRLNTATEIIEKLGKVYAEPKYDGLRVQIHINKNSFSNWQDSVGKYTTYRTFTRNLDETSHMFPELAKTVSQLACQSCILDAEAISYDPKTGKLNAFQETITRKRKHAITEHSEKTPIKFFVFDVLSIDGKSFLKTPLNLRKEKLEKLFKDSITLQRTPYIVTEDAKELHKFHNSQLAEGLEGAVMKKLDSLYQSGRKGWNWVKIKEAEGSKGKLTDTLDCVVMGYYFGRGKRTQFGIGAFLVGVLGKDDQILTVAKIGTGLSDDQFGEMKRRCGLIKVAQPPNRYVVEKSLIPDVWVDSQIVVEIAADEITRSPVHSAGYALRFPRLVKFRDDKGVSEVTTKQELAGFNH